MWYYLFPPISKCPAKESCLLCHLGHMLFLVFHPWPRSLAIHLKYIQTIRQLFALLVCIYPTPMLCIITSVCIVFVCGRKFKNLEKIHLEKPITYVVMHMPSLNAMMHLIEFVMFYRVFLSITNCISKF